MRNYLLRHAQTCIAALGRLSRQPVGTLMTVAAIGIALTLPAALSVVVRNGQALAGGWVSVRDFSVYLQPGTELARAEGLQTELRGDARIEDVTLIPADQALAEFRSTAGMADLVASLDDNPLPHALVIRPSADASPAQLDTLKAALAGRSEVDLVQLDTEWVAKLNGILELARRAIWVTALLLGGAVLVIVGNTIRLDIQNQRAEIEVSKLLGATDAFVRRPFLYTGFWYGAAGAASALLLLGLGLVLLRGPAQRLSALYGGGFDPLGLDGSAVAAVLAGGLAAGLGGAWLAVTRHLQAIQPRV